MAGFVPNLVTDRRLVSKRLDAKPSRPNVPKAKISLGDHTIVFRVVTSPLSITWNILLRGDDERNDIVDEIHYCELGFFVRWLVGWRSR
jgi:hypothetical protein